MPDDRLDSAESYLIGYILSRFGCVNGNRGKDEKAFIQGYQDAVTNTPPKICPEVDIKKLDWQFFHTGTEDVIVSNRIKPSIDTDLGMRYWGFHTLDSDKIMQPFLSDEKLRLDLLIQDQMDLRSKLNDRLSFRNSLWFISGSIFGFILAL